ncbi:SDR family oxidoreductase [Paenibacillus albiflavus]|uniref:SDR family oxidoreductase n=1 Tax=Paenibacillus albiflavus TaxID=2545760 RepID=A0A4R4EGB6_9BACL|nr:SDR family oxidoreductase [Paenibacillus albiflavus]TCZ77168.1 SDR family oxidoreductase [Paenibacillus albiflavus]
MSKLLLIGLGHIGEGLVKKGYLNPADIILIDKIQTDIEFCDFRQCDVSNPSEYINVLNEIKNIHVFDTVIYLAGVMLPGSAGDIPYLDWESSFQVNVTGAFLLVQNTVNYLIQNGGGNYIFISSIFGSTTGYELVAYNSSKAALNAFVKSVALDYVNHNIRANTICPSFVKSPMLDSAMQVIGKNRNWFSSLSGFKNKHVNVSSIGEAIKFFMIQNDCNGVDLLIDGGYSIR